MCVCVDGEQPKKERGRERDANQIMTNGCFKLILMKLRCSCAAFIPDWRWTGRRRLAGRPKSSVHTCSRSV